MLGEGLFAPVYESSIMDAETPSVETLIATVLADIQQKGYSSIQPFDIGEVEQRMMQFAEANNITLGSDRLYISAKQLQHCMRTSKKGVSGKRYIKIQTDRQLSGESSGQL